MASNLKKVNQHNVRQGHDKTLEVFEKTQKKFERDHPYFYIFSHNIYKLTEDTDLLITILALYHDHIVELTDKVITDEIKQIHLDSFERLRNFTGSLSKSALETLVEYARAKGIVPKEEPKLETNGFKSKKQVTKLDDFMRNYCGLSKYPDVISKRKLIYKYASMKRITLPPLAKSHIKGQAYYFWDDDLKSKWPTYRKIMPTLPPLKAENSNP